MGLVAPQHVVSSQTGARTRVPCIGRRILNHCITREALAGVFLTNVPPGKSRDLFWKNNLYQFHRGVRSSTSSRKFWDHLLFSKANRYRLISGDIFKSLAFTVWNLCSFLLSLISSGSYLGWFVSFCGSLCLTTCWSTNYRDFLIPRMKVPSSRVVRHLYGSQTTSDYIHSLMWPLAGQTISANLPLPLSSLFVWLPGLRVNSVSYPIRLFGIPV